MEKFFYESGENEDYCDRFRKEDEGEGNGDSQEELRRRIQHLQQQLLLAQENQLKLKVTNNQLTRMVSQSNKASVRKTHDFIANVQNIVHQKMLTMSQNSVQNGFKPTKKGKSHCLQLPLKQKNNSYTSKRTQQNFSTSQTHGKFSSTTLSTSPFSSLQALSKKELRDRMSIIRGLQRRQ